MAGREGGRVHKSECPKKREVNLVCGDCLERRCPYCAPLSRQGKEEEQETANAKEDVESAAFGGDQQASCGHESVWGYLLYKIFCPPNQTLNVWRKFLRVFSSFFGLFDFQALSKIMFSSLGHFFVQKCFNDFHMVLSNSKGMINGSAPMRRSVESKNVVICENFSVLRAERAFSFEFL